MSEAASPQSPPPQAQLMQMAMGFTSTFLLRAAAQMRLADHLADGPKTADQLAALTIHIPGHSIESCVPSLRWAFSAKPTPTSSLSPRSPSLFARTSPALYVPR